MGYEPPEVAAGEEELELDGVLGAAAGALEGEEEELAALGVWLTVAEGVL